MVFIVGLFGFFCGFALALMMLKIILRDHSKEDLLNNKSLHWKYGLLAWGVAIAGAVSAHIAYRNWVGY